MYARREVFVEFALGRTETVSIARSPLTVPSTSAERYRLISPSRKQTASYAGNIESKRMDEQTETMTISNRSDFALWAIERAKAIVSEEGGNLAIATRDHGEDEIAASANALGQAIVDALLEVFDGLTQE